jgi:Zn-dependent protease with chaperone function
VIINTGTLDLPNEQIAGLLTHEVGHISNKDTDLMMAVMVGNFILGPAVSLLIILLGAFGAILGFIRLGGLVQLFVTLMVYVIKAMQWMLRLFQQIWIKLGEFAMNFAGQKQEFRADEFSVNCGAGKGLGRVLTTLLEEAGGVMAPRHGFLATFTSSHPELRKRLVALANLGVPMDKPELLVD